MVGSMVLRTKVVINLEVVNLMYFRELVGVTKTFFDRTLKIPLYARLFVRDRVGINCLHFSSLNPKKPSLNLRDFETTALS